MKRYLLALLIVLALGSPCIAQDCNDGIKNGTESAPDCGGDCAPCLTGATCGAATDCLSSVCGSGTCAAASCSDGVLNGDEASKDCGGACPRCTRPACASSPLCVQGFIPVTLGEKATRVGRLALSEIISDRRRYYRDDPLAQMVVLFFEQPLSAPGTFIHLSLTGPGPAAPFAALDVSPVTSPKLELWLDLNALAAGAYTLRAALMSSNATVLSTATLPFSIDGTPEAHASFPEAGIEIVVPSQPAGFPSTWPITTGIPLPRESVRAVGELLLVEDNRPVPMQAKVRSRWQVGGSFQFGGSIAWLGVDFVARFRADGQPRRYRLLRAQRGPGPVPSPQLVWSWSGDTLIVNTGPARFELSRSQFAGIERADLDRDGDGAFAPDERVADGIGGPYVVDESGALFAAANDPDVTVEVEEEGPLRLTVVARGEYRHMDGTPFNRFVSRLTFHAGEARVEIDHRTIVTYDTRTSRRIADAGWQVGIADAPGLIRTGIDGALVIGGAPGAGNSVFVHQDRSDHVRVQYHPLAPAFAEGSRADGWLSAVGATNGLTLILRDMRGRFPKELELSNDPNQPDVTSGSIAPRLLVHFWPRHGHIAFAPGSGPSREDIYKMHWAHEGTLLDFNLPTDYAAALQAMHNTIGTADAGWDAESQMSQAHHANAQGIAFGGEFALLLHTASLDAVSLRAQASAVTSAIHAMATPEWNAASGVEQALAPRDLARFPKLERAIDLSYSGYVDAIVKAGDEFGMWSYGNVHNHWDASRDVAMLHRVWQNSHYHNVFAVWLQYFRSADPATYAWARATSDTLMDIATVHHPKVDGLQAQPGDFYHCKGFMPWGDSEVLPAAHWLDASASMLRYLLTGDGRSLDAARTWYGRFIDKGDASNQGALGDCSTYASNNWIRNHVVPFGEMLYYYQLTRDAQALVAIHEVVRWLMATRFECVQAPSDHPVWHDQWYWRYYALTRDERVIERLIDWSNAGYRNASVGALLYRATGDGKYLEREMPKLYEAAHTVYDAPGERYHGYQEAFAAAAGRWVQQAPYWMAAAADSSLPWQWTGLTTAPIYPNQGFPHNAGYTVYPPAGWSNASLVVLALPQTNQGLSFTLNPLTGNVDPSEGTWYLTGPSTPSPALPAQFGTTPPTLATGAFHSNSPWPLSVNATGSAVAGLFRLDCFGQCFMRMPMVSAASGPKPAEAAVWRRTYRDGHAQILPTSGAGVDHMFFFARPRNPAAKATLRFKGARGKYDYLPFAYSASPAYVRVRDASGYVALEGTVFAFGARSELSVTLDPAVHPLPWQIETISPYGPQMAVEGVDELLISASASELNAIVGALPP